MNGRRATDRAFTIVELLIAIVIIAILGALIFAAVANLRARAQRVQCMANLRALAVGAELYVQQNGSWPQIHHGASDAPETVANAWIAALEPFHVPRKSWICPTIENLLGNPDYTQPDAVRVDYFATPFDDKPTSPHEWPRQPWFIESGDVHGNGNLIIFSDGSISDLKTATSTAGSGQ